MVAPVEKRVTPHCPTPRLLTSILLGDQAVSFLLASMLARKATYRFETESRDFYDPLDSEELLSKPSVATDFCA